VPIELLNEVKGQNIVGGVPELHLYGVVRVLHHKLGCESGGLLILNGKILELFARVSTDEHRRNADARAGTIIAHDNIGDNLNAVVNHNYETGASSFSISHLGDESAVSTIYKHNLSGECILLGLPLGLVRVVAVCV
jgi:hypothetical protein